MALLNTLRHFGRWLVLLKKAFFGHPLVGEIDGRFLFKPPHLLTDRFGRTSKTPSVLEIMVDEKPVAGIDAGVLAKRQLFANHPRLVFNVCFSCARPDRLHGGNYANPESQWFNVFFGFYEIDVVKSEWGRPFGYTSSDGGTLEFDDLLRIGKADWNYFSNYVYGVPEEECAKHCAIPGGATTRIIRERVRIGEHDYIEAEAENVTVVSGYVSGRDNRKLVLNDGFWSLVWRVAFGRPKKQAAVAASFTPTRMKMRFYIRFEEQWDSDLEAQAYKTFMYGGSINMDYVHPETNDEFLEAQMAGVRQSAADRHFRKNPDAVKKALWKKVVADIKEM